MQVVCTNTAKHPSVHVRPLHLHSNFLQLYSVLFQPHGRSSTRPLPVGMSTIARPAVFTFVSSFCPLPIHPFVLLFHLCRFRALPAPAVTALCSPFFLVCLLALGFKSGALPFVHFLIARRRWQDMEPHGERPWTEHEKVRTCASHHYRNLRPTYFLRLQVELLAEILKAGPIPSHVLLGIIRDSGIQLRWQDIPLPHGMSSNCGLQYCERCRPASMRLCSLGGTARASLQHDPTATDSSLKAAP